MVFLLKIFSTLQYKSRREYSILEQEDADLKTMSLEDVQRIKS